MSLDIGIGIVGFGKIARDQHRPAIVATSGARLRAVCHADGDVEGIEQFATLADMLALQPGLDAVSMCQPPGFRYSAARAALLAGRHVFLEKPPAASLSQVEVLVKLAQSRNLTLFAAWHSREATGVASARSWLAGKTIRSISIRWKEDVRIWHPGQQWIWQPCGFGVFDPGINALSILTWLVRDAIGVVSADLMVPANRDQPIAANLTMETASGAPIHAEFDFVQTGPPTWEIAVETNAGHLLLENGGNRLSIQGVCRPLRQEAEYSRLYARFIKLIGEARSDVDTSPLRLVADAFMCGRKHVVAAFDG